MLDCYISTQSNVQKKLMTIPFVLQVFGYKSKNWHQGKCSTLTEVIRLYSLGTVPAQNPANSC